VYRDGINALQAADGAVLLGANEDREELARLHRDGFPFVFVGRREIEGEPLAYVGADYESATAAIVHHLAELGHRNILYIGGTLRNESAEDRENGFRDGMAKATIPVSEERIIRPELSSIPASFVRNWLDRGITTFVCEGLWIAKPLIRDAAVLGLHAPADFSIVALGNSGADIVDDDGTVTSLLIPRREMGAGAVQMLVTMLYRPDDAISRQILLPCEVAHGETVGPLDR
jgi:DNA-binding LacI/PurR family transcriptional regulator